MKKIAMPRFSALEKSRKEKPKFEAGLIYMSRICLTEPQENIEEVKYIWLTLL